MDGASCLTRGKPSPLASLLSTSGKGEQGLLPVPNLGGSKKLRVRAVLGHFLYRRVIIWGLTVIVLTCLTLYTSGVHTNHGRILDLVDFRKSGHHSPAVQHPPPQSLEHEPELPEQQPLREQVESKQEQQKESAPETVQDSAQGSAQEKAHESTQDPIKEQNQDQASSGTETSDPKEGESKEESKDEQAEKAEIADSANPHWLKFALLDGYYKGVKALVPKLYHRPEYPHPSKDDSSSAPIAAFIASPTLTPFVAHPDYASAEYESRFGVVKTCYLDEERKVAAPDVFAYDGVVQGQPDPVLGSYNVFGMRDDVCFDRFGRYGPYGLGYTQAEGGVGEGHDTESSGSHAVWAKTGKINYSKVDWGHAQTRCYETNKHRFFEYDSRGRVIEGGVSRKNTQSSESTLPQPNVTGVEKMERTAIVIRTYAGFQWTQLSVLNFRALISEVALRSGGEYAVHFLLHVRDDDLPIWADAETAQQVLDDNVPAEFHSMCTLWSEAQMRLLYPGDFGDPIENPSNSGFHGVYRSAHLALQHFALTHPQYAQFWNWEMDIRWVGSYYELFDRIAKWARNQSRTEIWERAQKYYIPAHHGSWDNFTEQVHKETLASGRRTIMGPVLFAGRKPVRAEERRQSMLPANCGNGLDPLQCGVGEDADLIMLNPIFDAEESGWVFANDVTGYDRSYTTPPRRCSIVTASRLSRRLLLVMHEETWRHHHGMFSEMFPASMALHHGLKATYAPHPVFLDRAWAIRRVEMVFDGGRDHSTSGRGSPFDFTNEHNHKGTSWYYNSEFAGLLWRRWLGYAQADGRSNEGGHTNEGKLRGGKAEEESASGTGRMCLRSMLLHPVKWENPNEKS